MNISHVELSEECQFKGDTCFSQPDKIHYNITISNLYQTTILRYTYYLIYFQHEQGNRKLCSTKKGRFQGQIYADEKKNQETIA